MAGNMTAAAETAVSFAQYERLSSTNFQWTHLGVRDTFSGSIT
jgi:hypothetical protein